MAQINPNILKYMQGLSEVRAREVLRNEARKLQKIAIKEWRKYLSSYMPKTYIRTGNAERSIKIGTIKKVDMNHIGIEVTYQNDLVYHDSIMGGKRGHAVMLISDGWHAKKLEAKMGRVHRLTYFEGTGYLHKVYNEYNKVSPTGVSLDIQWSGQYSK